ncbi:MAG TPA: ferredoxin--NADP reductase [Acidiphilium sp.]
MADQQQTESVISVHHWSDTLFSFSTTRDPGFRFRSGQFTMVGLETEEGTRISRAYSVASAHYDDRLEFFSIKVPNGPLTSRLAEIKPGDRLLIGRKPTGTLVLDGLTPGRRLFLLGTGTGLAPFLSIIRDPETYDRFETVILMHGVRHIGDLAYRDFIAEDLPRHELLGEMITSQLVYIPTVTREAYATNGRITSLLESGVALTDRGHVPLTPEQDRVMLCGSPAFLADMTGLLERLGFIEGSIARPGQYVIEKAFVEK